MPSPSIATRSAGCTRPRVAARMRSVRRKSPQDATPAAVSTSLIASASAGVAARISHEASLKLDTPKRYAVDSHRQAARIPALSTARPCHTPPPAHEPRRSPSRGPAHCCAFLLLVRHGRDVVSARGTFWRCTTKRSTPQPLSSSRSYFSRCSLSSASYSRPHGCEPGVASAQMALSGIPGFAVLRRAHGFRGPMAPSKSTGSVAGGCETSCCRQ
jgi:hypothetical protein